MKKMITKRALIERIRRKLAKESIQFKTNRGGPYSDRFGDYFLVDQNNCIAGPMIDDLEEYAREIGVLQNYEALNS